jgi:hypothetical protein
MMNYELAIDEDGEPFQVAPQVAGWRVRRALDGRGRPLLVHGRGADKGKPLILRANATHADLLAAAGPGRYRLEGVDEHYRKVEGVPVACTGPLSDDDDATDDDDVSAPAELVGRDPTRRVTSYGDVICQLVAANTRVMEKTIGQIGTVMSGVANLLDAVHRLGVMTQLPPPPPEPVGEVIYDAQAEQAGSDGTTEDSEAPASGSMIPDMIQLVIKEATSKAVTLIFEKISTNALPLEAILDWRKAAPPSTPPVPAPAAPSAPAAPMAPMPPTAAPSAPSWPTTAAESAPMTTFTQSTAAAGAAAAGVAPSHPPQHGATPAELAVAPAANLPENHEAAAALINAHVLQVWQGLSPPERARAAQLIARLTAEERALWMAELARLTLPEAIARARSVIHGTPPATATPQIPTETPKGEPS